MNSAIFKLNAKDFAKGILMFVGAAVITAIYEFIKDCGMECVDWDIVLNTGLSSALMYLIKNYFTDHAGRLGGRL
jgi:hypothetical protein